MFEQIRNNKIKSMWLIAGLGALLLGFGYVLGYFLLDNGPVGIVIASIVWLIMNLIAFTQGDQIFLSISKARKIEKKDHPQLFNIVEEMTIASGLPKVPDIYIIDDPSPNAFATGRNPRRASVAITSGLLKQLNRDELQGVMAHEIGHIKNRDVMLVILAGVLMGSIVLLSNIGIRAFLLGGGRGGRRSSGGGGGGAAIIMLVAIVLIIIAPIVAQLFYYALSRKREYLADASSAQYTRYPEGLASALEKLAASTAVLASANQVTAPMYIINPLHKAGFSASDLTSTHPPISKRVKILRSMGNSVSLASYDRAYRQVYGGRASIIPKGSLAGAAGLVEARTAPVAEKKPPKVEKAEKLERARDVSDLLEKLNKYTALGCTCGTAFRIPPDYKGRSIKCPRCGRDNTIPKR